MEPKQTPQKVVIIGGGLVGVSTAFYLKKSGFDVVLLEKGDGVGKETSYQNGGLLCPSLTKPWANPDILKALQSSLLDDESPIHFHPRVLLMPQFWRWAIWYFPNCTTKATYSNTETLYQLASYSTAAMKELIRAHQSLYFDSSSRGGLQLYRSEAQLAKAVQHASMLKDLGCDIKVLSPHQCVESEPLLQGQEDSLVGGLFSSEDTNGDAFKFTKNLANICQQDGVEFLTETEALGFVVEGDRVKAVQTSEWSIDADFFIVAAGNDSPNVAQKLGFNIPIFPVKGYSISIPVTDEETSRFNVTDDASKVYMTTFAGQYRVSGCAEIVGYDFSIDERRVDILLRGVKKLLRVDRISGESNALFWTGLRPVAPDDVPIISKAPGLSNVYINAGHGSKGFTLSCGSALILKDLVLGKQPHLDPSLFDIRRFALAERFGGKIPSLSETFLSLRDSFKSFRQPQPTSPNFSSSVSSRSLFNKSPDVDFFSLICGL
eukprot:GILI01032418.1.p1 GENE.GILI01032418.1~~GILI01032418.1.p1  ORF type:complete len:491 (+),score=54.40 GILI01032418.1:139-1611(+)